MLKPWHTYSTKKNDEGFNSIWAQDFRNPEPVDRMGLGSNLCGSYVLNLYVDCDNDDRIEADGQWKPAPVSITRGNFLHKGRHLALDHWRESGRA